MKTLLVDCYREDGKNRMLFYRQFCERHSEVCELRLRQLEGGFALDDYDAVVISGSQWMLSSEEPPEWLITFIRGIRLPTLGICFGHQLLARSFGTDVMRGELVEKDETIEIVSPWPLFAGLGSQCVMRESHREFLSPERVHAAGWLVGATSASCPVEAIRHPTLPLFGVQFHPERSGPPGEIVFSSFYRVVESYLHDRKKQ